jgi:hypothetical protein
MTPDSSWCSEHLILIKGGQVVEARNKESLAKREVSEMGKIDPGRGRQSIAGSSGIAEKVSPSHTLLNILRKPRDFEERCSLCMTCKVKRLCTWHLDTHALQTPHALVVTFRCSVLSAKGASKRLVSLASLFCVVGQKMSTGSLSPLIITSCAPH